MSAQNMLSLLGNVGGSDSIRLIEKDGKPSIVSFSFAVTEYRYNPETQQNEKMTDWHTAKAFGWVAGRIAQFVQQGQSFLLQGRLYKEEYEKDGEKRYSFGIQVEEFALTGGGSPERNSSDVQPTVETDEDEFPF